MTLKGHVFRVRGGAVFELLGICLPLAHPELAEDQGHILEVLLSQQPFPGTMGTATIGCTLLALLFCSAAFLSDEEWKMFGRSVSYLETKQILLCPQ